MEPLTIALLIVYALGALFFIYVIVSVIRAERYRRKLRDAKWMEDQLKEWHER